MNRRVAMVVRNAIAGDSRVRKSAAALAAAGWEVTIFGTSPDAAEHRLEFDGVPAVLVPVRPVLTSYNRARLRGRPSAAEYRAWRQARSSLATRDRALYGRRRPLLLRLPLLLPEAADRALAAVLSGALGGRVARLGRTLAGALTPGGGWRRLDPWIQEVELALAPYVEALDPAVIHAHDHHTVPLGARSTAVLGSRGSAAVWVHDAHEYSEAVAGRGAGGPRGLLRRRMVAGMLAELVPTARAVVTVSDQLAQILAARLRLACPPTVVLNAPTVAGARPAPSLRGRAGVAPGVPLLVYSGGLARSRNVEVAVRALAALPGVHLALVAPAGDDRLEALGRLAASFGAGDRLHGVPYVDPDQIVDYLSEADAGVVPAGHQPNHEISLSTKYLEYVQAGLPLVVSDVRAIASFTRQHGLGEVFEATGDPDRDAAALADAARLVLADPARHRRARAAAADVVARLTWEEQAKVLAALYARLGQGCPTSLAAAGRGRPRRGRG